MDDGSRWPLGGADCSDTIDPAERHILWICRSSEKLKSE